MANIYFKENIADVINSTKMTTALTMNRLNGQ